MRHMRSIALALALLAVQPWQPATAETIAFAPEGPTLTLRSRVMVDDDVIRLGDLFEERISDGDIAIAQAPKPGQTTTLEGRFLQQVARAYRLTLPAGARMQKVMVGRLSQKVTTEMVRVALAQAVQGRIGAVNDLDVAIDGGDLEFDLPTDVENSVAVSAINFNPASNRFAAILVAPADGPPLFERNVFGTVYETAPVPVLNRLVSAGETIGPDDIEWQPVQLARLANNSLTDAQQVIGHMTKRPLKAGQVLRSSDLVMAPVVRKNDLVRLVVQTGQMTLSLQGKVLQDAAIGQTVRVLNVTSNRQLSGTVVDAGTVAIGLATPAIN